jgi:hypothetical protein
MRKTAQGMFETFRPGAAGLLCPRLAITGSFNWVNELNSSIGIVKPPSPESEFTRRQQRANCFADITGATERDLRPLPTRPAQYSPRGKIPRDRKNSVIAVADQQSSWPLSAISLSERNRRSRFPADRGGSADQS